MPAPGRGTAVIEIGTILTDCATSGDPDLIRVDVQGETFDLPFLDSNDQRQVGWPVWILFVGRTGLILGGVGTCTTPE